MRTLTGKHWEYLRWSWRDTYAIGLGHTITPWTHEAVPPAVASTDNQIEVTAYAAIRSVKILVLSVESNFTDFIQGDYYRQVTTFEELNDYPVTPKLLFEVDLDHEKVPNTVQYRSIGLYSDLLTDDTWHPLGYYAADRVIQARLQFLFYNKLTIITPGVVEPYKLLVSL